LDGPCDTQRKAYKILIGKPEVKRPLGRPHKSYRELPQSFQRDETQ